MEGGDSAFTGCSRSMQGEVAVVNVGITAVQYLLLLAGEISWAYPWSLMVGLWLARIGDPALDIHTVAWVLTLSVAAARVAASVRWPSILVRVFLASLAVASVGLAALLELPGFWAGMGAAELWNHLFGGDLGGRAAVAAGFAGFLWWRGMGMGRTPMSGEVVEQGFRGGVVAMTCLLIFVGLAGGHSPLPADVLLLCALVMVSAGLVGMPLATVVDVGSRSRRRGGSGLSPAGPWLAMLLTVVGVLLVASLLLAQLLSFDRVAAAWAAVSGPLGDFSWTLVYILALPIGLLVELLLFLVRLLQHPGVARPRRQADGLQWLDQLRQREAAEIPPEVVLALKVALVVALAFLLVWLVLRALSRLRNGWGREEVEESHDFVWSWPGLGGLWGWLLARWRPIQARAVARLVGTRARRVGARSVMELYREFLALGASLGRGRRVPETPLEYQRRLLGEASLPGGEEVRLLTDSFNLARYGRPAARQPDLPALLAALARLGELWRGRP